MHAVRARLRLQARFGARVIARNGGPGLWPQAATSCSVHCGSATIGRL